VEAEAKEMTRINIWEDKEGGEREGWRRERERERQRWMLSDVPTSSNGTPVLIFSFVLEK
jgi:hypothetical protein